MSVDTLEAVQAFAKQEGYTFPLLADTDHQVADLYGVTRDGLARRVSFILDPSGTIRHVDSEIQISRHGPDLLARLDELQR